MAVATPVSLSVLARRANEAHKNCLNGLRPDLLQAIAAGDALVEAKQQLSHGQWIPWVEKNCTFRRVTAWRYVRIALAAPLLGANVSSVEHLDPEEVFRLLTGEAPSTEKTDPKPPRFEAWIQMQERIVAWAKVHDKPFAIQWLRELADNLEKDVYK